MRLAAAEPREAVLADRLEQAERRRRGEELDPVVLVRAVAEAPPAARALELRRPAVLGEEPVQRRDGVLFRSRVERLAQPLAQRPCRTHARLVQGGGGLVAVELEIAPQPARAQELGV